MRSVALVVVTTLLAVSPQDPSREAGMLRSARALGETTAEHRLLQQLVGEWDVVCTTSPPGGTAQEARGRLIGKTILGGRYVVLNHALTVSAGAVEAVQLLGFDTLRGHYTSSWRDDASTWAVECSGAAADGQPRQWELRGTLADARTPAGRAFRCTFDLRDAKVVKIESFEAHTGDEVRVQTQTWTRR